MTGPSFEADLKRRFCDGECDILFRVQTRHGWGGWRSFRKACENGNPPWPWEYPVSRVEWKEKVQRRIRA